MLIIVAAVLAITIPFAGQAFSIDGPLELDYARMEVAHPLAQALPHYSYWGINYDQYFNTHPRLLSLFLSVVIRISGGVYEVPVHLSLIIFPLIGALGIYSLGRRFRVSGLTAALLFLVSPMLMVNTHMEMVDAPGTCLWIAAIAAFIWAVDKRSNWLLALAALLMILTSQTFFQGLAVLPLALAYLIINRQFRLLNFLPVIAAGTIFGCYLLVLYSAYGQLPRFSYRQPFNFNNSASLLEKLRGNLTVLGGTLMFPLAAIAGFIYRWTGALVFAAASMITWSWSLVKYDLGQYSFSDMLLFSVLLPAGITVTYLIAERLMVGIFYRPSRASRAGKDAVFLGIWFFGVLAYAIILIPYPAPRYLLPALPPAVIALLVSWKRLRLRIWLKFAIAIAAIIFGLVFSSVISISMRDSADHARSVAKWVHEHYGDSGTVWYNGEFGFRYYMGQYGFRMTPNILNERYAETANPPASVKNPQPGDYDIYSLQGNAWVPYPAVMERLRPVQLVDYYNNDTLWSPCAGSDKCWGAATFLPYAIDTQGERSDEVMVWRIAATPNPLDASQLELYRQVGIKDPEALVDK